MKEPKTIKIEEIEYVRKDSLPVLASKLDGMKYEVSLALALALALVLALALALSLAMALAN